MPDEIWVPLYNVVGGYKTLSIKHKITIDKHVRFKLRLPKDIDLPAVADNYTETYGHKLPEMSLFTAIEAFFEKLHDKLKNVEFEMGCEASSFSDFKVALLSGAINSFQPKNLLASSLLDIDNKGSRELAYKSFIYHYKDSKKFYTWLTNYIELGITNFKGNSDMTIKEGTVKTTNEVISTNALTTAVKANFASSKKAAAIAFDIEAGKLGVKFVKEQIKPFLPENIAMFVDTTEADFVLAQMLAFMLQSTAGFHKHEDLAQNLSDKMITFAAVQEIGKFNLGEMLIDLAKVMGLDAGKLIKKEETKN